MRHAKKRLRLGSGHKHRKSIINGLVKNLISYEKIRTTKTKSAQLKPIAEKLITIAKSPDVHSRRQALKIIQDKELTHKLFSEIAPKYKEKNGGYLKTINLNNRLGDNAQMVQIEFI